MMKKIAILAKNDSNVIAKGEELRAWFIAHGLTVPSDICIAAVESNAVNPNPPAEEWLNGVDCVFVLGGDGTFLYAARKIGPRDIPLVGIKFGTRGFLAESSGDAMFETAQRVINGNFEKSYRMRFDVSLYRAEVNETVQAIVLNDVVLTRGALARLVNIETYINGVFLTYYRADGLAVATPTGSTGHSLSAGGPVVHPKVSTIVLTPICPTTLTNRPLLIPDNSEITLKLGAESSNMMVTFDGQEGYALSEKDVITIKKSPNPLGILVFPNRTYYDVLKEKLSWNQ